ncbi:MAG: tetratricopeptide repeat protein [Desulfosudaceae bacterium]
MMIPETKFAWQKYMVWFLLAVMLAGAGFHRVDRYQQRNSYHPESDIGFFYTEGAFQYRYARLVADNEPIPRHDQKAQWPEGIYPFQELTLLQEYLHGLSYRVFTAFFPEVPFHVFLIYFISFFSLLAGAALFFGARVLGAGPVAALFCAGLYTFTGAAYARIQYYELEYTAFPLMAASFVLTLAALKKRSRSLLFAVAAGVLLALALATWHFTRFYLLVFTAALALSFLAVGGTKELTRVFGIILGCVVGCVGAAGLFWPVLRTGYLIFSPAMIFGALLLAALIIDGRYRLSFRQRLFLLLAGAAVAGLVVPFGGEGAGYGHVWALLKYKLLHLLVKPDDPARLSFAGRLLWQGPFNTMSPLYLVYRYALLLPLAVMAGFRLVARFRKRPDFEAQLVFFMGLAFLALNVMVQRLTLFGAFFLGLMVVYLFLDQKGAGQTGPAGAVFKSEAPPGWRSYRLVTGVLLGGCLVFQVGLALGGDRLGVSRAVSRGLSDGSLALAKYRSDDLEMLAWIKRNTAPEAVFLSNTDVSPSLLTYADRAIVLQPKWETADIRGKYREIVLALFGDDEAALYRLMKKYQVDYYLYPVKNLLRTDPDSQRYLAGLSRLPCSSLIYRFHFKPGGFRHFRPVFRNKYYQLYRVVRGDDPVPDQAGLPYYPVYDESLFETSGGPAGCFFNDKRAPAVMDRIEYSIRKIWQAVRALDRGDRQEAVALVRTAVSDGRPDGMVFFRAAECMMRLDEPDQAARLLDQALEYDPANIEFKKLSARLAVIDNDPDQALAILKQLRLAAPDDPEIYNNLGVVCWQRGRLAAARDNFQRALVLEPDYEKARHNLEVLERAEKFSSGRSE